MGDNSRMDRKELKQQAHDLVDQLGTRQLEAVIGVLRCLAGVDEADFAPEVDSGEGIPPADIFGKFFS